MIKNKNILLTGGAGFIGGHLFEELIQNENFVVIIDNFNDYYQGKDENIKIITNGYEKTKDYDLIRADLVKKETYNKINENIDIIFHLAAQAGVRFSIENAAEVTNNNVVGTVNIFEYAIKNDIDKVVFASSSSVYGNPVYTPLDENHPKNPISPYAVSKLVGETYADYYYREYGMDVSSLRFYTVYGPRGRPDMAIRKFFNLILEDKTITIYGDGKQLRDFTYVSDIVNGIILAAESDKSANEVFNLGLSDPISVNDLVEKMYDIADKPKNVKFVSKQQGDVEITYSNTEKANKILNYHPKITIDGGLKRTYDWMVNHKS